MHEGEGADVSVHEGEGADVSVHEGEGADVSVATEEKKKDWSLYIYWREKEKKRTHRSLLE